MGLVHRQPILIAVEGPCFTGKTSVIENLTFKFQSTDFAVCPDYVDVADSLAPAPPPHATAKEELDALAYFINIDRQRLRAAQRLEPRKIIVFDRCYHTLLAHVYASQMLFGVSAWESAFAYVAKHRFYAIAMTFLLEVPESELARRAALFQHTRNPLFTDPKYINEFYRYFAAAYVDERRTLRGVDGNRQIATVGAEIYDHICSYAGI